MRAFLTRLELLKRVSEHDNELVKGLQEEINELNKTKEQLSSDQQSQQEKQSEIVNEKGRHRVCSRRGQERLQYP